MQHKVLVAALVAVGVGRSVAHSAPATTPVATPAPASVYERLHDDGAIAGMPGWSMVRKADANRCGGYRVAIVKGKGKVAAADQPLVTVLAIKFPTGLDLNSKTEKTRDAALKKFNDWVALMQSTSAAATKQYEDQLGAPDLDTRLHATARIAQITRHVASVLARAPIPDFAGQGEFATEASQAFCDKMAEVAEPVVTRSEAAIGSCAAKQAAGSTDWTAAFCAAP